MKKKLRSIVDAILDSNESKDQKVKELLTLAEMAYDLGDLSVYEEMTAEILKIFPEYKFEKNENTFTERFLNKNRFSISTLPDIDLDSNEKDNIIEYINGRYKK